MRWVGQVQPRFGETYTFYTMSDDGVRLWVNNQLLVDRWIDQGPTEYATSIQLQAGALYDIKFDYYENGGYPLVAVISLIMVAVTTAGRFSARA